MTTALDAFDAARTFLADQRRATFTGLKSGKSANALLKEQAACQHAIADYEYGAQWKCRGCGAWVTRW